MGLLILEDKHLEHVPGTATLEDLNEVASAAREHHGHTELKKSKDGIIFVPQPSEDNNGMAGNMVQLHCWPDSKAAALCLLY